MIGTSDGELEHPDELIVDTLDGGHLGWQTTNGIITATVFGYQVRVMSGRSRPCWRLISLDTQMKPISTTYPLWEQPRIDLPSASLQ